jgi:hypothetical protein
MINEEEAVVFCVIFAVILVFLFPVAVGLLGSVFITLLRGTC